jgi:hypothetical protein
LLLGLLCLMGCGEEQSVQREAPSNLKALLALYSQATTRLGHRPRTENEFKDYVSKNGSSFLDAYKIASADHLFISPRDNQPYVVIYGPPPQGLAAGVVAYEQTGVDGGRQIGFDLGNIDHVDDARFRQLVPNAASK